MANNEAIPRHLGIILDGNRRWARAKGLPTLEGHRRGAEVFKEIVFAAFERDIKYVTGYIFSSENRNRAEEEVGYLMNLVVKAVQSYLKEFQERGLRIVVIGSREGLSDKVLEAIDRAEQATANNTGATLSLCFNYGGREEIVDAIKRMMQDGINHDDLDSATVEKYLYQPEIPSIDLIIRTSGEQRLSNFMLWRAAYSEFIFFDKHWPDFDVADLDKALSEYANRNRRFGG